MGSSAGSVPLMKISLLEAYPSWARYPETESTDAVTICEGCSKPALALPDNASSKILLQIGEAPETPEATLSIASLLLLPTQTPTNAWELPPIVQLSRLSFVVPVLTATVRPGMLRSELVPKTSFRALLSDNMLAIK